MKKPMYYESHITVSPLFGKDLDTFKNICAYWGFRVADLYMLKDRDVTPERSNKDTFCTGRHQDQELLHQNMMSIVSDSEDCGLKVWRYKIEAILTDVRLSK